MHIIWNNMQIIWNDNIEPRLVMPMNIRNLFASVAKSFVFYKDKFLIDANSNIDEN